MTDAPRHFILATAGHVDHGKSALVKALTGVDPDRLPEEKARGITIDLGFAHLDLPSPVRAETRFRIGIVDVPGHEDFVKNMVAGVGSIDLALLIVASDDGWMPQTEEHVQILSYLGVTRAVVALTKVDLPEADEELARADIQERLTGTPFEQAPVVSTSVVDGHGIDELRTALGRLLDGTPPPHELGKPRLPVDRVFSLRGVGTVVTGTLTGGVFNRGDAVVIQPAGLKTRIRSLQTHHCEADHASPGVRTALNLVDVGRADEHSAPGVARGHVVTLPNLGGSSECLDISIYRSPRLTDKKSPAARPLRTGMRVNVHLGSGHTAARLRLLAKDGLAPGEEALAQLRLEAPVFAFIGDRLIIRDWSERWTLAGGIVLDVQTTRAGFRSPAQKTLLTRRATGIDDLSVVIETQLQKDRACRRNAMLVQSRYSAAAVERTLKEMVRQGRVAAVGDWWVDAPHWTWLRDQACQWIDQEHRERPHEAGLPVNRLRQLAAPHLPHESLFELLTSALVAEDGCAQTGNFIGRRQHNPTLAGPLEAAAQRLVQALSAKPFDPPSRKELAADPAAQQALRFLIGGGQVIEVGEGVVLLAEHRRAMVEKIKQLLQDQGAATVSEIRQAVGASRRVIVPLLEQLDGERVTRRDGDKRVLCGPVGG